MKKTFFKTLLLMLSLTFLVVMIGCRAAQRPAPNQAGEPIRYPGYNGEPTRYGTPGNSGTQLDRLGTPITPAPNVPGRYGIPERMGGPGTVGMDNRYNLIGTPDANNIPMGADANRNAKNIANQLAAMKEIKRATVVISGNTALVGLNMERGYNYNRNQTIRNNVVQKVKSMAPNVTKVAVTESSDLYGRIDRLFRDMNNGRTMQGLGNEFRTLVDSIIPDTR